MYNLGKSAFYMRVGSRKQLNSGDKNLKDILGILPKTYENELHDQKYIRGIREIVNYRKFGKMQ